MPSNTSSCFNSNMPTDGLPQSDANSIDFSDSGSYNSKASGGIEGRDPARLLFTRSATSPSPHLLQPSKKGSSALTSLMAHQPSRSRPPRCPGQSHGAFEEHYNLSVDSSRLSSPSKPGHELTTRPPLPSSSPLTRRNSDVSGVKAPRKRDKLRTLSSRLVAKIKRLGGGKNTGAGQSGYTFDSVLDPEDPHESDGRSEGPRDTLRRMDRIGNPTDFVDEGEKGYILLRN